MHIRYDWNIELNEEEYLAQAEPTLSKLLMRPSIREDWDAALAEAIELIRPAAIWDSYPVREFQHERVVLANGTRIGGGPFASVVAGASELLIGVCTVGAGISQRISEEQHSGSRIRAMFLDNLGTLAVGQMRQHLCQLWEMDVMAQGLHASTTLSPGESEWPVTEQAILFSLLDTQEIGVTLTESMVMSPVKSLSVIMGTGAGPLGSEGGTNCDFCTMRDQCKHSHYHANQEAVV